MMRIFECFNFHLNLLIDFVYFVFLLPFNDKTQNHDISKINKLFFTIACNHCCWLIFFKNLVTINLRNYLRNRLFTYDHDNSNKAINKKLITISPKGSILALEGEEVEPRVAGYLQLD